LSKIDLEVADSLEFEDGDIAVIIKQDGSIGRVIMPKMDKEILETEGYRKLLDVVDILQPGSKEKFIKYTMKTKGSIH
tara:strand:- start:178 stop:411 length:234 start_codon:yes stop_codon:yes gene_type:complete